MKPWTLSDGLFNTVGGHDRVIVFPHSDDRPTRLGERCVGRPISSHVRLELLRPPLLVRLREGCVLRATMPETAVDEHRDPLAREGDIGPRSTQSRDTQVDPVAETAAVELPAQSHLGVRIPVSHARHPFRNLGR